jgi:signal transduction histidine kinase
VQFHLAAFELLPLLEECRQIMQAKADEKQIVVQLEVPQGFPPVDADRDKLKQVVLNLISNAVKYNCTGGRVTLSAGRGEKDWTLAVKDTGMGIPTKALPHLFEKFYRVNASEGKVPGTGLGLSICKQIVSGHGGSIAVKSTPGKGTTFTIHIPCKKIERAVS